MSIFKPIVYGTVSRHLGPSIRTDGHTHQWTVYVKPYHNEDMSLFVQKVNFRLHESYKKPSRDILKPPYDVTETGWGEFEIRIQIHFKDGSGGILQHVTLYHILKLFQHPEDAAKQTPSGTTVASERYEEVLFHSPPPALRTLLESPRPLVYGSWEHNVDYDALKAKTLASILNARVKVKDEVDSVYARLNAMRKKAGDYRDEIRLVGKKPKRA